MKLPFSNEILKVNEIAFKHLLSLFDEDIDTKELDFFSIKINRHIGHSTQLIKTKKYFYHTKEHAIEIETDDINLSRIVLKILKRTQSKNLVIRIYKDSRVSIEELD